MGRDDTPPTGLRMRGPSRPEAVPGHREFVARCKAARIAAGLSVEAAANRGGIQRQSAHKIERGRVLKLETLARYARGCGVEFRVGAVAGYQPVPVTADPDPLDAALDGFADALESQIEAVERQAETLRAMLATARGWQVESAKLDAAPVPDGDEDPE